MVAIDRPLVLSVCYPKSNTEGDAPHSFRATTAPLLLNAGVDIIKVQELLGDRPVIATQICEKGRRSTREEASRDVPI